ncbi:MAG: ABC transporter ATP-binding protein [Mariprofundales bacterium]
MLTIQHLSLSVPDNDSDVLAVRDVSLSLHSGKVLALVGESGCGKTLTAQSLLRLGEHQGIKRQAGDISLDGNSIFSFDAKALQAMRGGHISMIFQEPMTALNPVFSIGAQLCEVIRLHLSLSKKEVQQRALDLLQQVGLSDTKNLLRQYPDALSGGMRQRILIAMAMAAKPEYIIADEPTTALDVSVQARVVQLLRRLQQDMGMGMLLVTHDFGLVAELADSVAVMYAGEIVEQGQVQDIFDSPMHPYTRSLLACRPESNNPGSALTVLAGSVPAPGKWPKGCHFAERCPQVDASCRSQIIALNAWQNKEHQARCILCINNNV